MQQFASIRVTHVHEIGVVPSSGLQTNFFSVAKDDAIIINKQIVNQIKLIFFCLKLYATFKSVEPLSFIIFNMNGAFGNS